MRTILPTILGAALVASLAVGSPAAAQHAESVTFTDIAGDANGVNAQERGGGDGIATGPASVDAVDLREITVAPVYSDPDVDGSRSVEAFTVSITLTAPPASGYAYHLSATGEGCRALFVDHYRFQDGDVRTQLRVSCNGERAIATPLADAVVEGRKITTTVPLAGLPASVRAGGTLTNLYAYTRGNVGDAPLFPFPVTPVQFDSVESRRPFVFGGS